MNTHRNPVGWFEIYVQDMERAKTFYQHTLGLTLEALPGLDIEMWMFPMQSESPGCSGALVKMPGKDSGSGGTLIYFGCEDCAVEGARAAEHGGRIVREKMSIGEYGFIVLVNDPEGNLIGLHSMK